MNHRVSITNIIHNPKLSDVSNFFRAECSILFSFYSVFMWRIRSRWCVINNNNLLLQTIREWLGLQNNGRIRVWSRCHVYLYRWDLYALRGLLWSDMPKGKLSLRYASTPRPVRGRYDFHNIAIFAGPHNLRLLSSKAFAYDTHVNSFSDSTYYAHEYFESSIMVLIMVILIILIHFPSEYSRKYRINMSPTLGASLFYSLFQFHAQILKLIVCWISKLDALL